MQQPSQIIEALLQQKLLPLYYHGSAETSLSIVKALYEAGIRVVEYTHRGPSALTNFRHLKTIAGRELPDLILGIGTIKNTQTAQDYIDAGADFIICPSMDAAVGKRVQDAGLLWIPGCMTPTEIATAENAGASIVKIFPGSLLGPAYIASLKDIFPDLKFLVTGGVEAEEKNLSAWFNAGVSGVGMGSKLIDKKWVEKGDFKALRKAAEKALKLVRKTSGIETK
jgi:2-dehydro-3-deoxyphosphogluconate aldolase / (4S)-4-hydroxy-2-oxoglutarate aldolase